MVTCLPIPSTSGSPPACDRMIDGCMRVRFPAAGSQVIHPLTWVGATHVLTSRFDPAEFVRLVAEQRVTATILVPTMIRMLVYYLQAVPGADVSSLRLLHYGAAPMPVDLLRSAATVLDCESSCRAAA